MRAVFVKYDEISPVEPRQGINLKPFMVDNLGASLIKWDKGVQVPAHDHADEQIDFCLKGKIEWTIKDESGERKEILTAGMVCGLEPHVVHTLNVLEDSVAIEIWCPADRHREIARKLGLIIGGDK